RLCAFIGLVLIGGMIRIDACMLQLAVAVPIALWIARNVRFSVFSAQWARGLILPLVIAGAIAGVLRAKQSYVYPSGPGWERFEEFNRLRAQFTDYQAAPFGDESRAVYQRAGWTENDYEMLMSWFFENPELYSRDKFREILAQAPRPTAEEGKQLGRLLEQVQNDAGMRLMVLAACISVLFVGWRGGLAVIVIVALTVVVAMIGVVIVLHRLPPWFSGPLLALVS